MSEAIQHLREISNNYTPSQQVAKILSQVVLAPVIGPAAIGKNTCMGAVAEIDTEFGVSQGFTTRPQEERDAVEEYRFLPHKEETLTELLGSVKRGELVQFAVHPTTDYIYGSDASDYGYPYILLDCLASAISPIRRLPFKKIVEVSLVTDAQMWMQRFESTRGGDPVDMAKRLLEARDSLEWSLEQGDDISWVYNTTGQLETTAHEIRDVIKGTREPNKDNRLVGEQLLKAVRLKIDS